MTGFTVYEAKKRQNPTIKQYMEVLQSVDWCKREHISLWFHGHDGNEKRDGRTEMILKRLREREDIRAKWYDGRWVYCANRINRKKHDQIPDHIYHGLGVTEGIVRYYMADKKCQIIPHFKIAKIVPDAAIGYANGSTLLYEFCTDDNTRRRLKQKIEAYKEISGNFVVVFVLDVFPQRLANYVDGPFYFIDYESFKTIPYGEQLTAQKYIWGGDGQIYPLR
jgi:hypothetical protein